MRRTATILAMASLCALACTSSRRSVYLLDASAYLSDSVHRDEDDEALLEFLDYSTYFHIISDTDRLDKQNRPGVFLSAKNTAYLNWNGDAAFGGEGDTCWIHYRSNNEQVTVGRSAAVSVFNFFNGETLRNNPEEYFDSKELNGSIKLGNTVIPFHVHQKKNENWKTKGWIELNRDSLFLQPAPRAVSGNDRSEKQSFGLQLVSINNRQPLAAIDLSASPRQVFIRKDLPKEQRSLIASYLFVLLCYL